MLDVFRFLTFSLKFVIKILTGQLSGWHPLESITPNGCEYQHIHMHMYFYQ